MWNKKRTTKLWYNKNGTLSAIFYNKIFWFSTILLILLQRYIHAKNRIITHIATLYCREATSDICMPILTRWCIDWSGKITIARELWNFCIISKISIIERLCHHSYSRLWRAKCSHFPTIRISNISYVVPRLKMTTQSCLSKTHTHHKCRVNTTGKWLIRPHIPILEGWCCICVEKIFLTINFCCTTQYKRAWRIHFWSWSKPSKIISAIFIKISLSESFWFEIRDIHILERIDCFTIFEHLKMKMGTRSHRASYFESRTFGQVYLYRITRF